MTPLQKGAVAALLAIGLCSAPAAATNADWLFEAKLAAFAPPSVKDVPRWGPGELAKAEIECLAQAIYFESRGESLEGQEAVAAVVLNRVAHPGFPNSVCGVVRQGGAKPGCQFSWYCDELSDKPRNKIAWLAALDLARDVAARAEDPSDGALFFHAVSVKPRWARKMERVVQIDNHIFYRCHPSADSSRRC